MFVFVLIVVGILCILVSNLFAFRVVDALAKIKFMQENNGLYLLCCGLAGSVISALISIPAFLTVYTVKAILEGQE